MDAPMQSRPFLKSRGMKIPKHPDITTGRVRGALREGLYERKECDAVMKVVQQGDVVLELGAGIGYMSTLIATKKPVEHVHAFEANPGLIPYIRSVHEANNVTNVTVHHALLAPEDGEPADFFVRKNFLASSLDRESGPDSIVSVAKVEVRSLPKTLATIRPTVLVCDIEGAEAGLLASADWSGLRAAVIELHPQWIGQAGVQSVFDTMHKAGLTYFPKASEAKVVTFRKGW
ncbi:FkbM family methyltransferase [Primorskyibacter marinus]|uniref:FkbM family methyltransferase n=1 Tax=Primorskyibacter marinus TaxID=1977320 RepID=UPI000E301A02|nr:FkbM family methyltransferase [Primorskyibacter marinus]